MSAERIDALVRLTGELIIAKNSIGHALKLVEHDGFGTLNLKSQHAALDRLVNEIQRAVIVMRVLPLRVVFQRFPRLIREMSAELRKPAVLVVEGEDTEADKTIVEVLAEPFVHLLRNALDHGVEEPGARTAAGKPTVATIRLRAFRAGEHVVIEVADDGAGIDVVKVQAGRTAAQLGDGGSGRRAERRGGRWISYSFLASRPRRPLLKFRAAVSAWTPYAPP